MKVALRAIESARQCAEVASMKDRSAHVGYHLVGEGRRDLEIDVGYRPRVRKRFGRLIRGWPATFYFLTVGSITAALIAAGLFYYRRESDSPSWALWVALLLLIPASEVALVFMQRLIALIVKPRRMLRLDFKEGLPPHARTMVIVPVLLTSVTEIEELIERLEVSALANSDARLHFAILSDFVDATSREMPDDEALLDAARSGIEELNSRFSPSGESRFFLFHRERRWNARDRVWMGWERKRGKIEEFNRVLRGATDTSFQALIGSLDVLPSIRYCLTLDSDTRLPRDVAKKLLGIMSHPLNQPQLDPVSRRVTRGYGILQPRVSVTLASAAGSLFARIYAGHTGVDPYTTAVSDLYQDLFDEGIFTGKGLYDVDAFMAALDQRVPENAGLSHDLFEGLYARTALVTDIEVVDDYPSSVLAHARRQHRWVRGDWQILLWLFPFVPTRSGLARNRLPLISRWKILDNLRRSLVAPASLLLLLMGWTALPGNPTAWTLATLAALTFSPSLWLVEAVGSPRPWQPLGVMLRHLIDDTKTAFARAGLQLTFLAYQAYQMTDAITVTLVRVAVTHRKMLEWQPAARTNRTAARSTTGVFFEQMRGSPLFAAGALLVVAISRPAALTPAAPVLVLWIVAPLIASRLSRPVPRRVPEIRTADYQLFRQIARKTWRYFDTFVGSEDQFLSPDNCQETPDTIVAHRTSPTNIGMGLLAVLAAHDLGFIQTPHLVDRIDRTLTTIEGMPRFEGHLFNWYDTQSLAPLAPRYVSSVDSGNLASALLTLSVGLRELAEGVPEIIDFVGPEEVAAFLHRAIIKAEGEKVVDLADRRPLKDIVSHVRSIVADPATSESEKVGRLRGQAGPLEAIIAELDAGPENVRNSDIAYWARHLRRDIEAAINPTPVAADHLEALAHRAAMFAEGMNFRLLYDEQRALLSIGYRPADAEGPGRLDNAYYDLLASEARLASFFAIAKGDVPRRTGSASAGRS